MKTLSIASSVLSVAALSLFFSSCTVQEPTDMTQVSLIPKPTSVTAGGEAFHVTKKSRILVSAEDSVLFGVARSLAGALQPATGFPLPVEKAGEHLPKGSILLTLSTQDGEESPEAYTLEVTKKQVTLSGNSAAGVFRAVQTLRQLLPAAIESKTVQPQDWVIPTGIIKDKPEYGYRGVMLDVSRHFFSVDEVKRYIDLVSLYKINVLHLHLSDDQGWRIEIKSRPKLTEIGGQTEVGGGQGGFYTQEEYQEIVAYAAERFMTIVPEIDMPGHTNAALASYPELNCDGKARELYTGTHVGFSTLCTDKEEVYQFLDDVIGELAKITPGPFIHIGGDESHATPLEDYIPFMNRAQKIVQRHGKRVLGWDEISHSTLLPNTVVHFWANDKNTLQGVAQHAQVLMSPANHTYLDMKYDSTTVLGQTWAGLIPLDTAYMWDPATLVEGIGRENILGVEAPIWSETLTNISEVEYMAFPRVIAISEVAWTAPALRSWEDFRRRLAGQKERLNTLKVNYYPSPQIDW